MPQLNLATSSSIHLPADCLADRVFCTNFEVILATSTEVNAILITNPSTSGKKFVFRHVKSFLTNSTACGAILRRYKNPTITLNGTSQTIVNGWFGSSTASLMQIYSLPTISVKGTLFTSCLAGSPLSGTGLYVDDYHEDIVLEPGNSVLITGQPDGTNRTLNFSMTWLEI